MSRKKTNTEFLTEVYELVADEYTFLEEYKTAIIKIKVRHNICNHEYSVTPSQFLSGRRCPQCFGNKRKTTEEFKKELFKVFQDNYSLIGEYINARTKIKIKHNACGCEYDVLPNSILAGHGCMDCYGSKKKNSDGFKQEVYNLFKNEYSVLGQYLGNKIKIKVRHNICNYEYETMPINFLRGFGCPSCANNLLKTNDRFIAEIYDLVQDEYTFLEEYVNCKTKIKVKHNKCNHEYSILPNNFLRGERCPKCGFHGTSNLEQEMSSFIKNILPSEKIIENDRSILGGKELDLYIPNKNIAFEFNGLYWHCSKNKDKSFHLEKTLRTQENGIQLIHIFEDEWINKKSLIKKKISHILGCDDSKKIYARKCEVKKIINSSEKTNFLNENHLQGADKANFAYGLYYEEELIALMSFIKPRINMGRKNSEEGEYELSRYATKYNLVGGFGKLLKHIVKLENVKEIYTYADLRWTNPNSNIYLKNKFEYVSTSAPNYWYLINRKREGRYSYQKAKLKEKFPAIYSDEKTEEQIMLEAGYYRIYDCGNLKYKLKIE